MDNLSCYIVLVSFLPKFDKQSTELDIEMLNFNKPKSVQNRTFIYGSWAPFVILKRMNESRDRNILTAATKACDVPIGHIESLNNAKYNPPNGNDIYGIMCIIGPVKGIEFTRRIVSNWEKLSRGPQPRTVTGFLLAKHYNLSFSVNFFLFFQINPQEILMKITDCSMEKGSKLIIQPQTTNPCLSLANIKKIEQEQISKKKRQIKKKRTTRPVLLQEEEEIHARKKNRSINSLL